MPTTTALRARWLAATTPTLRGRLWMALSGVCFSTMLACVRHVSDTVHPFETAFIRSLFGFLFLVPFLLRSGIGVFRTTRVGLHLGRGGLQVVYMMATFYAVTLIPLADFTALGFSAPLFATIAGVALLGERVEARRFAVLAVGFLGVMTVLRPGSGIVEPGALLVIASSAIWAGCLIIIKLVSRTDSAFTITAWYALLMSVLSFPPALFVWTWPSTEALLWLALVGILGNSAHFCLAQAMRAAEAGAVLPLDFLRLVWASAIGWLVFGQTPDLWTWIGGAAIFASATYLAVGDARAAPRPAATISARTSDDRR